MNQVTNVLMVVLAVLAAIALIGILSMWLMHGMMMGPGMMAGSLGIATALVVLGVAAVLLMSRAKPSS